MMRSSPATEVSAFFVQSFTKGHREKKMKRLIIAKIILLTVITLGFSANVWGKTVTLSWDASPSAVSGYKVYYDAGSSVAPLDGIGAAEGSSPIDVGNVLTYTVTGLPDAEEHYFAVTAYDASNNESTYSNTVTSPAVISENNPPVLSAIGNKSILEDATLSFTVSATDADADALTYSASGLPTGAGFNPATRAFTWTPALDQSGIYSVTFTVSDGSASDTETIQITVTNVVVNHAPTLSLIGDKSVDEGETQYIPISATDPEGDSLNYSFSGMPNGAEFNSQENMFVWPTNFDQAGVYPITVTVSDGELTDAEQISITVRNVNRAPVLADIGRKSVLEAATLSFTVSATDADSDTLTYSASGLPTGAGFNPATRVFTWTPTLDQSGIYSVTFTVSDGSASDTETIQITVTNVVVNHAPVLSPIGTKTVSEGSQLTFTIIGSDLDNDALSYSAEGLPEGATFNPTTRFFSWTPEFQISENTLIYPVTFKISDGVAQDSEIVTINVTNVNRAPVMESIGSQTLTEGDSFNLIINASDPDNNPLIYSASTLPSSSVFIPSTRSFSWIPGNDQAGSYNVTFTASDGSLSDSETVTFTVSNGNEAPVLNPIGAKVIAENSQLMFVVTASDVNSDSLSYSASGLPVGAEFDAAQQRFTWTPDYTQSGNFTVTLSVTDGTTSDSEAVAITVTNSNRTPVISGSPDGSVMATTSYSFTPVASDPDSDPLTFSIVNQPSWATFSLTTGELSGTPTEAQVGNNVDIVISVSDVTNSASLTPFSVGVIAYVQQDSDGDGILDHLDAFPDDSNEWADTDGDQVGNNSDLDDDNDGIADVRDGFPLDATQSGWVISATAGAGGYLSPEGETSVLYGGSQGYQLTPMAGYYINDLLVDNVSVGLVADYEFENVSDHHSIAAIFAPVPAGLSYDLTASGLIGVERVDGGDDSRNLVDSKPKQDLDYRFRIVLRDSVAADQRKVFLMLDGYKYEMVIDQGAIASGADYVFTTRLGASFSHRFYFSAEDVSGNPMWRYPQSGDLPGPAVELLNGKNVVGIAARINAYALSAIEAFNDDQVYRWAPDSGVSGEFELTGSGVPIASGEGYVLKRAAGSTLANLSIYGEITDYVHEFQIKSGWNLISNPYGGNVALADIEVRFGAAAPVSWLTAATNNLVVDAIYSYLGTDWGNGNEFASAAGTDSAILVPWIGYWIYVNPTEQEISLIISKPLQ
jgi:PKD repeat protein